MDAELKIVIASLIFSGFFSAVEIAFISANRLHIEIQRKKGVYLAKVLARFIEKPSYFIATTLLGNTIALVVYGYYFALLLEPSIEDVLQENLPDYIIATSLELFVLIIQVALSTLLVLATAEFLPKSLSLFDPDKFLKWAALPMNIIYWIAFPFVWVIVALSKIIITKVFGLEYKEDKPAFGLTDLNVYISNLQQENGDKTLENKPEVDQRIFSNALEFKRVKVRECMIPRKEIVAIEDNETIEELEQAFTESGHSKIPVYHDTIDNIIGYCHHLDLFKKPSKITQILNDIIIVPETMLANELMIKFISDRKSIALVVDEFGGTSGIVTIEDIMEEIFGEIVDEYDEEELPFTRFNDHHFELSARYEIDYLNEQYSLNIPTGDYDTLSGYILYINQNIPEVGEKIPAGQFDFIIKSKEEARIDLVELIVHNEEKKEEEKSGQ